MIIYIIEDYIYSESWIKCKEECSKSNFSGNGCCSLASHLYTLKECTKSNTKRRDDEEPQMTSRFGGAIDRYATNTTQIREENKLAPGNSKLNRTVGDMRLHSVNASAYHKNKQQIKESIKNIKERIGKIVGKSVISPGSNTLRILFSDESFINNSSSQDRLIFDK